MGIELLITVAVISASSVAGIYGLLEKYESKNVTRFDAIQNLGMESRSTLYKLFTKLRTLELKNNGEHEKLNTIIRDLGFVERRKNLRPPSEEENGHG
jgi:hypothetical protein